MKNIILLALVICFNFTGTAQDIKLKKNEVLLEKVTILKYERTAIEASLYDLETDDEVLFIRWMDNETASYSADDFIKIHFIELDFYCETS